MPFGNSKVRLLRIMKTFTDIARTVLPAMLFLASGSADAQTTVLKQPPESHVREKTPLNLARAYLGAQIELVNGESSRGIDPGLGSNDPNGGLAALISDDETIGFPVPGGSTRVIVTLPRPVLLSSIEISSFTIHGRLNAWVSPVKMTPSDSRWRQVVKEKNFVESRPLFAKFGSADAAYVMLEFVANEKGRVGALGIYGDVKISDVRVTAGEKSIDALPSMGEVVDYNYANLVAGGNIAYTSSVKGRGEADKMIDDVRDTDYAFASSDPSPITIVQLESERPVRRIAVSYEAEKPGKMEFYLMKGIPGDAKEEQANVDRSEWIRASNPAVPRIIAAQSSGPKLIEIDDSYFKNSEPTGMVETQAGNRRVAFECSAQESNFLMVRWLSNDGSPAGDFRISEINVFGNTEKEDAHVGWDEPTPPGEGSPQNPIDTPSLPTFGGGSLVPPDLPNVSEP